MDKIRDGSFNANSYLSVLLVVDVVIDKFCKLGGFSNLGNYN